MEPTNVNDIMLPQELVELKHLKTKDGEPVRVMCEALDDLTMAELTGGLSGVRPSGVAESDDPAAAFGGVEELARLTDARAAALIGRATWFAGPDGEQVRPAFWFDPNAPRHERSLPGRFLRYEDRISLLTAIMRAGNYLGGGPADATSFPVHGEGVGDGVGVGSAGGPDGEAGDGVARLPQGDVAARGWPLDAGEGESTGTH